MQNNIDAPLTTQKLSEESKFNRLVQICRVSERKPARTADIFTCILLMEHTAMLHGGSLILNGTGLSLVLSTIKITAPFPG